MGVLLVVLLAAASLARGEDPPRVLMLFANDRLLPANLRVDEGIRRSLDPKGNQSGAIFFTEFLDVVRFPGPEREKAMEAYLQERYRDMPPDVLLALGSSALDFWLERRDTLFPGTPVVFGGVGLGSLRSLEGVSGVTGLPMEMTVVPVVESLLAMRPKTRKMVLVHGSAISDRKWRDLALQQCAPFADRVEILALPELPLEELKARLASLSDDTAVIYLTYFQSPKGETYTPAHVAKEIALASAVPVMGTYDTYIGTGVLGVSVSPFEEEGVAIGELTGRVLSGEQLEGIGILPPLSARLIVDEREVKRWRIKTLPAETDVRFHSPTMWEEHRGAIIAAVAVFALQTALITGLLVQRAQRRRSDREIRSLRQELTHAGRVSMLGQLSTSLAHELNQPLGAILRNAEAAELFLQQEQPDLGELREIVADIRKDDQRAGAVIDRLRGLLKRREMELLPVDLGELIDDVEALLRADGVRRHVEIVLDVPRNLPHVNADRVHLQQVLLNLMINALDALSEGNGDSKMVEVRARTVDARTLEIAVEDNGPGIPPETLERLFEPFFTTKEQGMGVGLSICRTIIEAHHGKITAKNRKPHGSVFCITLPIERGGGWGSER